MNLARSLLLLSSAAVPLLAGCSTTNPQPPDTLTHADIVKLHELPDLKSSGIRVSGTLLDIGDKDTFFSPGYRFNPQVVSPGQTSRFRELKTIKIAGDYSLPETQPLSDSPMSSFPVTPATQSKSRTVETGWSVDLTPKVEGAYVKVDVHAIHTTLESRRGAFGEGAGPVVAEHQGAFRKVWVHLTDNVGDIPAVHTEEQNMVVRALPGKKYRIPISGLGTLLIEVERN